MGEIIKTILEFAKTAPAWVQVLSLAALVVLAAFYLRYHISVHRHLYDKTKLQVDRIGDYLSKDVVRSSDLQQSLVYEREDQIFRHVFGYTLEASKRKALLPIVYASDSPASWSSIKVARQYLKMDSTRLVVKITRFDRVEYYSKHVVAILFLLMALLGLISLPLKAQTASQSAIALLICGIPFCVSILLISSMWGYSTAKKIQEWLKTHETISKSA